MDDAEDEAEMLVDTGEIDRDRSTLPDGDEVEEDRMDFSGINGLPMGRIKDTATSMY